MSNPYDVLSQLTPEQAAAWRAKFGSPPTRVNDLVNMANQAGPQQPSPAGIADLQNTAGYFGQLANTPAAIQSRPDAATYAPGPLAATAIENNPSQQGDPRIAHLIAAGAIPDPEMKGIAEDVKQQTGQTVAAPNQIAAAASQYGRALGGDANATNAPIPPPVYQPPRQGSATSFSLDSPEGQALQKQLQAQDAPAAEPPEEPVRFAPTTVIPGGRTPAAWTVKQGNPMSAEDLGAIDQARAAQQAGIANTSDADAQAAQARANDLATQQKAVQDLATMQQARQQRLLDANQQQVGKMQSIVDQIRGRQIDDKNVFLIPGAAGKFFSAIGRAIGAGVQARLGLRQNPSLEIVNSQINEIVQQQRARMEQDKNSLGAQQSLLGQMQSQFGDQQLADQGAKVALLERAKLHADEVAQSSQVPRIKANAQALSADLGMQGAKEKAQFDQAAQDQVMRRDVMTRPQVFGGQQIGGPKPGAPEDPARQIVIPQDLGGQNVANQRWIATDGKSAQALRNTVEAASTIHDAYTQIKQLEEEHGQSVYLENSEAGAKARELITSTLGKVGALQGQSKLPIVDVDMWKQNLEPQGILGTAAGMTGLGATLTQRMQNMDEIARREMMTKIRTNAAEEGRRHITVTPQGVQPGVHYTGEDADKRKMPASAVPVPGMPYRDPGRVLQYKPEVRVGTPASGKGKHAKAATSQVVEPEEDDDE